MRRFFAVSLIALVVVAGFGISPYPDSATAHRQVVASPYTLVAAAGFVQSGEYFCVSDSGENLRSADADNDGIAFIEEMRAFVKDVDPGNLEFLARLDDVEAQGLAGFQYEGCDPAGNSGLGSDVVTTDEENTGSGSTETEGGTDAESQLVSDLEARVAELEARLLVLEARLDALDDGSSSSSQPLQPSNGDIGSAGSDVVEVSGIGSTVTDDFQLDAGRYEVTLTLESGCCIIIYLHGPSGGDDLLFNELFGFDVQGGTATDIYQVSEPGVHSIDSQNVDGAWTITFRKR